MTLGELNESADTLVEIFSIYGKIKVDSYDKN